MDLKHVSQLANLPLTPDEEKKYTGQLEHIVGYVSQLQQLNTNDIPPTAQSIATKNITRPDQLGAPCLKIVPSFFKVPAIFDND